MHRRPAHCTLRKRKRDEPNLGQKELVQWLQDADRNGEEDGDSVEMPKVASKEAARMMESLMMFWLQQQEIRPRIST